MEYESVKSSSHKDNFLVPLYRIYLRNIRKGIIRNAKLSLLDGNNNSTNMTEIFDNILKDYGSSIFNIKITEDLTLHKNKIFNLSGNNSIVIFKISIPQPLMFKRAMPHAISQYFYKVQNDAKLLVLRIKEHASVNIIIEYQDMNNNFDSRMLALDMKNTLVK